MDNLKLLQARQNLLIVTQRISISLKEIEKSKPDRFDYIDPMRQSISDLMHTYEMFKLLEIELVASIQRNRDLEIKCLDNMNKIKDLENTIKAIKF